MKSASEFPHMTLPDYGMIYRPKHAVQVVKKDGSQEPFNVQKVIIAIEKSAYRALTRFTDDENRKICQAVTDQVDKMNRLKIPIAVMHNIVEHVLEEIRPEVARSYRDYRNYKQDFVRMMDDVYRKSQSIMYIGDKENSNTDSALVATKRSLTLNQLNRELYQKFFLTTEEIQACRDGYIYIHDMSARRDTMNCFARNTRFVTDHGVKSFLDFEDGDMVNVLSQKGIWRLAVVHNYGKQVLQEVTFRIDSGKATEKTVEVTPNHRWFLEDGTETTDLKVGDRLIPTPNWKRTYAPGSVWYVRDIKPVFSFTPADVWCLEVEQDHGFILEGGIPTGNCCLFDMNAVLKGGFEMGNIWYNEPKTLDTAFDVIGDVTLSSASQQYGGFTIPEVDRLLEPYAEKSYEKQIRKYENLGLDHEKAEKAAYADVEKEMEQGFQGWEYKFNTVGSSRGDYPFIAVTAGLGTGRFAKLASITMLNVRRKGQGRAGHKKPVLFPKIVFLYDENLHGPGKPLEEVFEAGVYCSRKTMYPDWLSLTGEGYVPGIYKRYGQVISPMGCVDGQETVIWKYQDEIHTGTFEEMWNHLSDDFRALPQPAGLPHLYMPVDDVKIWDMMRGFVPVYQLIRNVSTEWVHIRLENGYELTCTSDHPLTTTERITKRADALTPDDFLYTGFRKFYTSTQTAVPTKVKAVRVLKGKKAYSYDVTTESSWFDVSGIWSHNCRAFLSPWYERGGMHPADEKDRPVFVGRFNIGAISLHLPMILAKARQENSDFYEVLDYYLNLIRNLHIRTYAYLGEMRASTNPLAYCEGGFYGGHLDLHDKIRPLLKPMTASFGITALNELQMLYNGKSIVEDGAFVLEVMEYINRKITEFKEEDGNLYAIYGTPAESLCSRQVEQFRKKYGIIKGVSDREYVSNSFHCHVTEDITPIEKQNLEYRFWNLFNGGKIQYVRYPVDYNVDAVRTLIRRAMNMGYYEGVNMSLAYCDDCGYQELEMDVCPKCGSKNLTKIDRMNGYLSYSRIHGDTRLNAGKMAEIAERKSM